MPSEAHIESRSRDIAAERGHILLKLHHSIAGMPDRVLILNTGRVVFIEFKTPKEGPTPIQKYWLQALTDMHHRVAVVRSLVEFRKVLTSSTEVGIMGSLPDQPGDDRCPPTNSS
jgi:hypothetical protein